MTGHQIRRNLPKFSLYCAKMRQNKEKWRAKPDKPYDMPDVEFELLHRYAQYYNVLYGDL